MSKQRPKPDPAQRALAVRPRHDLSQVRVMSFGEHLEDLRRRLMFALFGLAPLFILGMIFGRSILEFLMAPARRAMLAAGQSGSMQVTSFLEAFAAYFKVSLVIAVILGAPWVLLQAWLFVAPGLHRHERRFAHLLVPMSGVLSLVGVAFLYAVMLPAMLAFLINFGASLGENHPRAAPPPDGTVIPTFPVLDADPVDPGLGDAWINRSLNELRIVVEKPENAPPRILSAPLAKSTGMLQQYKVSEYVGLVFAMSFAFAIGFQAPVVILLLGWAGIADRAALKKKRRYAYFTCAIAAALLTPTGDPISLAMLAIPLVFLYEFGIFLLWFLPAERVARGWGAMLTGRSRATREPNAGDD